MTSSTTIARVTAAIAFAVALLAAGAPARAEDKGEARRRFAAGVERAEAGAYEQAMAEFRRAYDASPNYAVLYNIAEMQRALGDAVGALETFQRYLTDGGAAIPAARRAKVTAAINAERAKTGSLTIRVTRPPSQTTPLRVLLDDNVVDVDLDVATVGPLRVNAGRHKVAAAAEGSAPAERDVIVAAGATLTLTLTLTPSPAPAAAAAAAAPAPSPAPPPGPTPPSPAAAATTTTTTTTAAQPPALVAPAPAPEAPGAATPRSDPSRVRRTLGYAAAGAGAAGLAVAAVSYYLARSHWQQAIDAGCTRDSCTGGARSEYESAGRSLDVFNVSAIAGGVLLAGGAILLVSGRW